MMKAKISTLFAVSVLLATAGGANAILIDSFEAAQTALVANFGTPTSASQVDDPAILGGERDLLVTWLSGDQNVVGAVIGVATDKLTYSSDFGTDGTATVVWDGNDNSSAVDTSGLNVDLTADGSTGFLISGVIGDLSGASLVFTVWSSATDSSTASVAIPTSLTDLTILFASFSTLSGSGADWTAITAIQMVVDATGLENFDASIGSVATNVPEPGSLMLLGAGLAGIGARMRRRKNRV